PVDRRGGRMVPRGGEGGTRPPPAGPGVEDVHGRYGRAERAAQPSHHEELRRAGACGADVRSSGRAGENDRRPDLTAAVGKILEPYPPFRLGPRVGIAREEVADERAADDQQHDQRECQDLEGALEDLHSLPGRRRPEDTGGGEGFLATGPPLVST